MQTLPAAAGEDHHGAEDQCGDSPKSNVLTAATATAAILAGNEPDGAAGMSFGTT